eukprot:3774745-Pyramimonas_sp.AAC.1
MATATKVFCEEVRPLGLVLQLNKSGHLAVTRQTEYYFKAYARVLGVEGKRHMRHLGHDMSANGAVRG